MSTLIRKQWLDLTFSPTGLTADDIKYSDTTSIKSVLDNINYAFTEYNTQLSTRTLIVTMAGTGSGTITSNPSGINCGDTCEYQYDLNSTVTLTALPDSTSVFSGWSGSVTGSDSTATVTMNSNKIVNAIFDKMCTLTVTMAGTGSGTVTSNPSGINCGATCSYQFLYGTSVVLTATPDSSSAFSGWSGDTVGTDITITVTMNSDKNVTATFNPSYTYTLTVTKSGTGSGIVTSNPSGINCGATCSYQFASGVTVILEAIPDSSSMFLGWSGDVISSSSITIVNMNSNKSVTAMFADNTSDGYFAGGNGGGNYQSFIDKLLFNNNDLRFTLAATLSQFVCEQSACNSSLAGYFAGGFSTGEYSSGYQHFIDKLLFSNELRSTLAATLSRLVESQSACNSTLAGYFAGGMNSSGNYQNFIDKLLFSSESQTTLTATLSQTVYVQSACNSTLAGYFAGGQNYSSVYYYQSFVDKLLFSDESRSTLTTTLSQSVLYQSACNSSLSGYFAGGYNGGNKYQSFIDKLLFSNETRTTLTATLSQSIDGQSACNSSLAGYFAGGSASNFQSYIDKLLFSNDSRSTLSTTLSQTVVYQSACQSGGIL
jgi:hypothetical protein